MFFISKQVDYATQFLMGLTQQPAEGFLSLKEFSKERNISFLFLQKIARQLRQAGLVEASKGPHGGYRLKVNPAQITLRQVAEAIEGKYAAVACFRDDHNCPITQVCLSQNVLFQVQRDILGVMEKYTLAKMTN